jgi:malonate transporter and related proteins
LFLAILGLVAPVFGLMALGYLAMRRGWLPDGADRALAQFGFKIAIPAMLFRALLGAEPMAASPARLLAAYLAAVGLVWAAATFSSARLLNRPPEDHAGLAMASVFGNTVMLGIPIALMAFGEAAATPLAMLISVEAILMWVAATLQIEWARRGAAISPAALAGVAKELATNTIILSLALGLAGRALGLTLPGPADRFVALLGQAGVPVALFALGMALANFRIEGEARPLALLAALKLLALPLLAYAAAQAMALPPVWIAVLTLHCAMPVGANAFIFATRYARNIKTVSAAIALTTVAGVLTVTLALTLLTAGLGVGR